MEAEVVYPAAGDHDPILAVFPPQTQRVFHNPIPFDTAKHMFDAHADARNPLVLRFFVRCQLASSWLFGWLLCPHSADDQALKAPVLIQDTVTGELVRLLIGHRFIVPTAFVGRTQEVDATIVGNQHQIFDRMLLLLATKMEPLFVWIAGAVYRSFGAIVEKKVRPAESSPGGVAELWMSAVRDGRSPVAASA